MGYSEGRRGTGGLNMTHSHLSHLWGEGQAAAQGELIDWKGIYERTSGYPFALTNTFFFIHKRATFLDFSAHDWLFYNIFSSQLISVQEGPY